MSLKATRAVWEHTQHSGSRLAMLLCIADFADDQGNAWGYMQKLAERCRMQLRGARAVIAELRASKELEVSEAFNDRGGQVSNLYRITIMDGPVLVQEVPTEAPPPAQPETPATSASAEPFKVPPSWSAWCAANTPVLVATLGDVAQRFAQHCAPHAPTLQAWRQFCKDAARQLHARPVAA